MELIEIVDWLIPIEFEAEELYRQASVFFASDKQLSEFLTNIAQDEAWHFNIMKKAAIFFESIGGQAASFVPDFTTKENLKSTFQSIREAQRDGNLTINSLLDSIVQIEFSEWNDFFLYVVNVLKERDRMFQAAAAGMHYHILGIGRFIGGTPQFAGHLEKLKKLPSVWREKVLVVDDFQPVLDLLKAALSRDYLVDTAASGQEAFVKLTQSYYDVIISDIDMPGMSGIELYTRATAADKDLDRRFLFFSGGLEPQVEQFLMDHNLPYLSKPASLGTLQEAVAVIISKAFSPA